MPFQDRTAMLIGEDGVRLLEKKHVAVFGLGGVGGYVAEALARGGLGALTLFDGDRVTESNRNRQLIALCSNEGKNKAEEMASRILDIHPGCHVTAHPVFYTAQNAPAYPFGAFDYVVDAVDMVSAKIEIIVRAKEAGVPVISSMGAGNKLHPECFEIADLEETEVCPLARILRKEMRKRRVRGVKVVYSREAPLRPAVLHDGDGRLPGSVSFVPGAAGLVLAGAVIRDLLGLS
ncbi:tRNA threonylcarbamoyladenosine dehydratase [Ruminococcaceae bacterium OttesenSCG-928-I18]|nr:tRNA threonylcarbamoyladenosine dehydratase [Ruminococcaceae bacterium OttesenSCG-928-I18]